MADREEVIDILGACGTDDCDNCPINGDERCSGFVCVPIEVLNDAIALLREQEAVKPIVGYGCYLCGVCKNPLNSASQKFCSECGKAVKWNG